MNRFQLNSSTPALILSLVLFSKLTVGEDTDIKTRIYQIPKSYIQVLSTIESQKNNIGKQAPILPHDSFAPNHSERWRPPSGKSLLESIGISFPDETSASLDLHKSRLTVSHFPSELQKIENFFTAQKHNDIKQIYTLWESIELDQALYLKWTTSQQVAPDGAKLRDQVQEWLKQDLATIVKISTVVSQSGNRAESKSVHEFIYPTEYDPPEVPNEVTLSDGAVAPVTPATPTAFEVRDLGTTLKVDATIGADDQTISLNLDLELVELESMEVWHKTIEEPKFHTHLPKFYQQKISTQVTLLDGIHSFLGLTRPLKAKDPKRSTPVVLHFVRADISYFYDWSIVE